MDFQAVIKAILNKGDVESQLNNLVQDRDVHINPIVGTNGSTNTTLNNQIKRQANAQAKSYVQYRKSAKGACTWLCRGNKHARWRA